MIANKVAPADGNPRGRGFGPCKGVLGTTRFICPLPTANCPLDGPMRNMSFALTEAQLLDGTKTVTRRLGWTMLKPGDHFRAVRKAMGLRKG